MYSEQTLFESRIKEGTARFRSGRKGLLADSRQSHPRVVITPEALHKVDDLVHCDLRIPEDKLVIHLGTKHGRIQIILHDSQLTSNTVTLVVCFVFI